MNVPILLTGAVCLLLAAAPADAGTQPSGDAAYQAQSDRIKETVRLMASLARESRVNAARIRAAYAPYVASLGFHDRRHLAAALRDGRVARLPAGRASNVRPRLTGAHPIGEADLAAQPLYVAARPETLGLLLHLASQVPSAALDVTSLVRHRAYQQSLARRNPNARASVPTHTMGLAFDISVLNVPLPVARAIRDAVKRMAADGDLLFIAERQQLVFHIVPAPARRAFYAAVFETLTSVPRTAPLEPAWPVPAAVPAPTDLAILPPSIVLFTTVAAVAATRRTWRGLRLRP